MKAKVKGISPITLRISSLWMWRLFRVVLQDLVSEKEFRGGPQQRKLSSTDHSAQQVIHRGSRDQKRRDHSLGQRSITTFLWV